MAIEITDVSNALQKVIMPFIQDNFPKQTILLDQVKRNKGVTFMNNAFYAPVRSGRNGGVTALANDGNQLISGKSSIGQANVGVKVLTGTFDISKLTIDATKTAKGAVANQLTWQAEKLAGDFAKSVNRQYFMDGSGVIAQAAASANASAVVLQLPDANCDDGIALDRYGTVNGDISPTEYLSAGNVLGVGTAAAAKGTIASVGAAGTVTFSAAVAHAAYDAVGFVDGNVEGFGTMEIEGLGKALSSSTGTSTYAGLARSTYGWTPQFGSTSEALTLSNLEDQYLAAKKYASPSDRYAIFVNKTLYKRYGDILTSMRRTVNESELLGGWTGLEFAAGAGKVGVFLDFDTPDGDAYIVNLDTLTICQTSDLDWMESPNEGALVRRHNYLTYQATMHWFTNLLCLCPAANGRVTQKTD